MKIKLLLFLIGCQFYIALTSFQSAYALSYGAAYPYRIAIPKFGLRIEAVPYDNFGPSPMIGATRVFKNNKLLYTIDLYYHDPIVVDESGANLYVVKLSDDGGIGTYASRYYEIEDTVFSSFFPFLIRYSNGVLVNEYLVREYFDYTKIPHEDFAYNIGLAFPFTDEEFKTAKVKCGSCHNNRKIKAPKYGKVFF